MVFPIRLICLSLCPGRPAVPEAIPARGCKAEAVYPSMRTVHGRYLQTCTRVCRTIRTCAQTELSAHRCQLAAHQAWCMVHWLFLGVRYIPWCYSSQSDADRNCCGRGCRPYLVPPPLRITRADIIRTDASPARGLKAADLFPPPVPSLQTSFTSSSSTNNNTLITMVKVCCPDGRDAGASSLAPWRLCLRPAHPVPRR